MLLRTSGLGASLYEREPYGLKCAVIGQEGVVIFSQRKCQMHQCITNYYVNVNLNGGCCCKKTIRWVRCARYRDVNTSFRKVKQVVHECYV